MSINDEEYEEDYFDLDAILAEQQVDLFLDIYNMIRKLKN